MYGVEFHQVDYLQTETNYNIYQIKSFFYEMATNQCWMVYLLKKSLKWVYFATIMECRRLWPRHIFSNNEPGTQAETRYKWLKPTSAHTWKYCTKEQRQCFIQTILPWALILIVVVVTDTLFISISGYSYNYSAG